MQKSYGKEYCRIFFGVLLILASAFLLLYNALIQKASFDMALGLIDLMLFLAGLLLTIFGLAALPEDKK